MLLAPAHLAAQAPANATNPLASNRSNIERGRHHFADNCGICHGFNAQGGDKGPSLNTGQFRHGSTDAELYSTITHGVPGTVMPGNALPPEQVWAIITYLRSKIVAARSKIDGNAQAGEKTFWSSDKCARCHMVAGRGGTLGPDLTRIGATRTVQYLTEKVRDPNKELTKGMHEPNGDYVVPISNGTVVVVTKAGQRITGVPRNEDTFSIQMLGTDNEIHLFLKSDLKEVMHEEKSLMPSYNEALLSDIQLRDLLAYLATLR
ncbi:MAG: c-type cytochrome [Acidobacteriia bacterium]|nr:c-type cytochrome [Terriglobia bacterium]